METITNTPRSSIYPPLSNLLLLSPLLLAASNDDNGADDDRLSRPRQVFEQMMRQASERPAMPPASMSLHPPSSPSALGSPSSNGFGIVMPLGTPARRLSSCVVARDGGGEFFAQSPAPGRPASFFR